MSGERSTIVGQNNHSPLHEADSGQMVPPLARWSDVVWLAWTKIAGNQAGKLHYIIHENITTDVTRKVMEILTRAPGEDTIDLPWPGRLYDLRSSGGKVLLATPHIVGAQETPGKIHTSDMKDARLRVRDAFVPTCTVLMIFPAVLHDCE